MIERNKMIDNDKTKFPTDIDWKTLDDITRKWAVMSQFEQDQDWYVKMKEQYE